MQRRKSMKLLILGGTGRTGRAVVEQALAAGHDVTALARSPEKLAVRSSRLRLVAGQATDAGDVARAMAGVDAVISTLGGGDSVILDSTRAIIEAAHGTGVTRVVVMSSFLAEADRFAVPARLLIKLTRGAAIEDKLAGERLLRQTDLDWTIAYPSRLTDGPATGSVRVQAEGMRRRITETISREDVARWLIEAATYRQAARRGVDITGGLQAVRPVGALKVGGIR
jgi:uncharacterized protein YbjT (DUF2867 family)